MQRVSRTANVQPNGCRRARRSGRGPAVPRARRRHAARHPAPLPRRGAVGLPACGRLSDELRRGAEACRGARARRAGAQGAPRARAARAHGRRRRRPGARRARRARDHVARARRADVGHAEAMTVVSADKDYEALSLVMVAAFEAPIEEVWELWADPRKLERWWGPPAWPATVVDHELAVGGAVS